MREGHIQSSFSTCFPAIGQTGRRDETMKESSPSPCEEQQGSRLRAFCLQTYESLRPNVRSSSPRRVDLLPSRKRGPRITVGQKDGRPAVFAALSEPARGEIDLISRTKLIEKHTIIAIPIPICNTVPFPGNSCGSFPSRNVTTTDAAAALCVQKRGGLVRNDVEQSS